MISGILALLIFLFLVLLGYSEQQSQETEVRLPVLVGLVERHEEVETSGGTAADSPLSKNMCCCCGGNIRHLHRFIDNARIQTEIEWRASNFHVSRARNWLRNCSLDGLHTRQVTRGLENPVPAALHLK